MLKQQTQSAEYWTTSFKVTRADVEALFAHFLENETPLTTRELALSLIRHRLAAEEDRLRKQISRGEIFQPRMTYEVGQEIVFPAFGFTMGKVVAERAGQNHEYGDFTVIEVEFEDSKRHEFASGLTAPHKLNYDETGGTFQLNLPKIDPESIYENYGEPISDELEARLVDEEDAVFMGGRWFLQSLLAEANVGHLNLAEAVLDLNEGGPLTTAVIMQEIEFAPELPEALRSFSLNMALSQDERFDNVGTAGQVQWYLRRLEPAEVVQIPPRLAYQPISYDHSALDDELRALELELADEWSPIEAPETRPTEANIVLIYPHRRVGTLPLNALVEAMFPVAEDSARMRLTLVDGQAGEEFSGWVMRDGKYVFGLADFYRRHRLPIGATLSLRATDDPTRFVLNFGAHRPRTEYIRLAVPENGRLRFESFKRSIGAVYDELMILGAEDIDGVDDVWAQTRNRRHSLVDVMTDLVPALAKLFPQNAVHAKTLYSAVNVVRRCPPGPIFAALMTRSEFQRVGGPYWRLSSER